MTFAKLPPLFKTITKSCACHDICSSVTFARHCQCDSWKQHLRHVAKCCACHDNAKGHITKCCACHEKTTRLHWHTAKVLRLSRKTRKRPPILWFDTAKKSISCETSSTFHTLKVRIVSQCECTAQWQRINELATTTRRRHDDDAKTSISCETSSTFHTLKVRIVSQCECTAQWQRINELATTTRRVGDDEATTRRRRGSKTKRTQVQPQTPTINGNPSLRIREKCVKPLWCSFQITMATSRIKG